MSRLYVSGNVVDQNEIPVIGALVFVRAAGVNAALEDAAGESLANPLVTIADGFFEAFSTSLGTHTLEYYWGGKLRRVDTVSEIDRLQAIADSAEAAASVALGAAGPLYTTTAAGLAATTNGDEFNVDNATGTATVYLNNAGSAVTRRTIILNPSNAGTAAFIGTEDGDLQEVLTDILDRLAALEV